MHIYPWQIDPPSIEHRCLEYHYTKLGRSIYIWNNEYIPMAHWPPSHSSIDALYTTTPNLAHLMAEQCIYAYGRWTPWPIEHRCLEYHYTKLGTSNGRSIYMWQFHIGGWHRYTRWTGRLSHQTSDLSHPCNSLPKGCDLCFTQFQVEGEKVVIHPATIKQLKLH